MSAREPAAGRRAALAGRIGPISVAGLLDLLAQERATGCFRLSGGGNDLALWFLRGRPVHGQRRGDGRRLRDVLLRAGLLDECQLAGAELRARLEPDKRLMDILLEAGILDRESVGRLLLQQALDLVAVAMGCRSGSFRFQEGHLPDEDGFLRDVGLEPLLWCAEALPGQAPSHRSGRDGRGQPPAGPERGVGGDGPEAVGPQAPPAPKG